MKNNKQIYTFVKVAIGGLLALVLVVFVFDISVAPSQGFLSLINKQAATPTPASEDGQATIEQLSSQVLPEEGYTVGITWGNTGDELVKAGGVDMSKYRDNYADPRYEELLTYLTENKNQGITINQENAYFWVNTLWALGLTQRSDVLDKGIMRTDYGDQLGNFASTGGWTLGSKDAVSLYSSADIIPLSDAQQQKVAEIAENVYRPCCGNSTAFPDCNHGMAALGLIELMVAEGYTDNEIYDALLAFNSYWFPQTYMDLAYYFKHNQNTDWDDVDAKLVLGADYSSSGGYLAIKEEIGTIPGLKNSGASCGA